MLLESVLKITAMCSWVSCILLTNTYWYAKAKDTLEALSMMFIACSPRWRVVRDSDRSLKAGKA